MIIESPQDAREIVKKIQELAHDDEAAHSLEDELHIAVLKAIRDGYGGDVQELADVALRTLDIEFARWCA